MTFFLKLLISFVLIGYVLFSADLFSMAGWLKLFSVFAEADLLLLFVSIFYAFFIDWISSIKVYFISRAKDMEIRLGALYRMYLIGRFFNLVMPTSIGGDVVRVNLLAKATGRMSDSAAVIFVERLSGFLVLVLLTLGSLFFVLKQKTDMHWVLPLAVLALAGMVLMIYAFFNHGLFIRIETALLKFSGKWLRKFLFKFEKFRLSVSGFAGSPGSLLWAIIHSVIFYLFAIGNIWLSAYVFSDQIRIWDMLTAVPVMMFIMNFPISIGGIGLMEFSYAFVFGLYGIDPAAAVSTAILMRFKILLLGAFGWGLFTFQRKDIPAVAVPGGPVSAPGAEYK
ncbi:MAG: flippase-like domain-containing protein [Desulfobacterales bacterium]|nr:flippase-like domain-containing protein [Desulfobacterales bacterium]